MNDALPNRIARVSDDRARTCSRRLAPTRWATLDEALPPLPMLPPLGSDRSQARRARRVLNQYSLWSPSLIDRALPPARVERSVVGAGVPRHPFACVDEHVEPPRLERRPRQPERSPPSRPPMTPGSGTWPGICRSTSRCPPQRRRCRHHRRPQRLRSYRRGVRTPTDMRRCRRLRCDSSGTGRSRAVRRLHPAGANRSCVPPSTARPNPTRCSRSCRSGRQDSDRAVSLRPSLRLVQRRHRRIARTHCRVSKRHPSGRSRYRGSSCRGDRHRRRRRHRGRPTDCIRGDDDTAQ